MKTKDFLVVALAPLLLLLVPLVAMRFTAEVNWTSSDFVVAWVLLAGTAFAYRLLATRKIANLAYRAGAALAVAASLLIVWINLAVGIIGSEANPANLLYGAVLLVGVVGTALARFQPQGLARAALAAAGVTFLVPVIAFLVWRPDFSPGVAKVFLLNFFFVLMFAGAGWLFRRAAGRPSATSLPTA